MADINVLEVERKTGDTYPVLVTILDAAGDPYPLTDVTQIALVVSDLKDETLAEEVEIISLGSVVNSTAVTGDDDLGQASFPVPPELAALVSKKYSAEIRMTQSTYLRTTETFNYRVKVRVGSTTAT